MTADQTRKTVHETYEVVQHDGGWAYRVGDVFSETFGTHEDAHAAAEAAAERQRAPGTDETIEYRTRRAAGARSVPRATTVRSPR
jgi:hypothetical protein